MSLLLFEGTLGADSSHFFVEYYILKMFLFSFYDTPVVFVWVVFNHLVRHQFVYNVSGRLNQNDKEYGNEED